MTIHFYIGCVAFCFLPVEIENDIEDYLGADVFDGGCFFLNMLVEDDPYGALRYRGSDIPAIKTLAPNHVVYVSTLSKIFAPGLRIGFCVAPEQVGKWLVIVKQGTDLHSSTSNQALAAEYISGGFLARHLPDIINPQ